MNPRYPIYVISKGRWEARLTSKALDRINVLYRLVIEPQEYDKYAAEVPEDKLLALPHENFGGGCSIPARNFVWEHSIAEGHARHWVVDDNIIAFWRQNNNLRIKVADGTIFRCCEDFTERYENVGKSGMNYYMFCPDRSKNPPYFVNTRVYSCILLRNDLYPKFAWRGRYNEDTDLSLRILKAGMCTILFNAFLAQKMTTGTTKGGNMTEIYGGDAETKEKSDAWQKKRMDMAQSLVDQHPDLVTITEKWGRPQHQVYYGAFKRNKLIRRPDWSYEGVDNYGMKLVTI